MSGNRTKEVRISKRMLYLFLNFDFRILIKLNEQRWRQNTIQQEIQQELYCISTEYLKLGKKSNHCDFWK
jgi:hypothetical protein